MGSYEVDSYEWSTIPNTTLTLYINCSITFVVVNNGVVSLMPKVTCSIECPISCALMPYVIEMVACLTFMSPML